MKFPWQKSSHEVIEKYDASRVLTEAVSILKSEIARISAERDEWKKKAENYEEKYISAIRFKSLEDEPLIGNHDFKSVRKRLEHKYAQAALRKGEENEAR